MSTKTNTLLKYRPDTPRSLEACLRLGIDPNSFETRFLFVWIYKTKVKNITFKYQKYTYIRDLESFGGKGVPREVMEMRYEAYNKNLISIEKLKGRKD